MRQAWLADDSAGEARLRALRQWWDTVCAVGAQYGYHTNCLKTVLLAKEHLANLATDIFQGTCVKITVDVVGYLGNAIGETAFVEKFFRDKIAEWCNEIQQLSRYAETELHAALRH